MATLTMAVAYTIREYSPARYQIESSQIVCEYYVCVSSSLLLKSIVEIKARTKILCFDSFLFAPLFGSGILQNRNKSTEAFILRSTLDTLSSCHLLSISLVFKKAHHQKM